MGGTGTGWLLAYFGYQPNRVQSPETINGIMLMMSLIPTVGAVIAVAALWFYKLDEATVNTMSAELQARRAGQGKAAALTDALPVAAPAPTHQTPDTQEKPMSDNTGLAATTTTAAGTAAPTTPAARTAPSAPAIPAWGPAGGQQAPGVAGAPALAPVALSPEAQAALRSEFQAVLNAGLHGLCFSPYLEGQAPGAQISEAQIRARLEIVRPHTGWVRSFSCTDGHEHTPRIAHELGMKTLAGAWLGTDRDINQREIDGVIKLGRAGHADIVAVGNEVLLREDMSEAELLACIDQVRRALPGVTIGYVDAYYLFEKHPRVTTACDVILANCYPFWEGCPREQAVDYMRSMVARAAAVAGGKPVIVSETGWPDQGTAFHGAVPSEEAAMRYFIDTQTWARRDGVEVFHFAAFDEAWKVGAEGDVGAYWGLWDKYGQGKFS